MQRQLRNKGGIMTVKTIRKKYGIGSTFQDYKDKALGKVRDIIPNELADVAVKAAPFVAPFYPGYAAAMRGIGRFDQRGSISDALKQGAATYAFGKGVGKLGGAEGSELGNVFGRQKYSMEGFKTEGLGKLFQGGDPTKTPKIKGADETRKGVGIVQKATDATIGKIPLVNKLPDFIQQQLFIGTVTSGATILNEYFKGGFRPQKPEETMEEYLAERKKVVGGQMRTYMDNYFKFDKDYSTMNDEQRNAFVARYNVRDGGRIGLQEGGLPTVKSVGGVPNVEGGRIVYDLGNGSYIYESPSGYEIVENGIYTSLGTKEYSDGSARPLKHLFEDGIIMRRANDPILLEQQAQSAKTAAPTIAAPTIAAPTPTGIQTIPGDKKVFNVMMDEKGNVQDDQSLTELFRETGTAPNITNNPINSVSDVFRLAGITGEDGISMGTDYGESRTLPSGGIANTLPRGINMRNTLQENLAANEEQRAANQRVLQAARAKLPGAGIMNAPVDIMPPMSNEFNESGKTFAQGNYKNEAEAIADLGLERYNQLFNMGGRVGFANGTEKPRAYEALMDKEGLDREAEERVKKINELAERISKEKGISFSDALEQAISIITPNTFSNDGKTNMDGSPKINKAKGGLMGIPVRKNSEGTTELDYRKSGGFVPIGVKEKADDVPAMLSKNEFVMTADAVRAAGGGSIEKGAQRMYDTMKKLESRIA